MQDITYNPNSKDVWNIIKVPFNITITANAIKTLYSQTEITLIPANESITQETIFSEPTIVTDTTLHGDPEVQPQWVFNENALGFNVIWSNSPVEDVYTRAYDIIGHTYNIQNGTSSVEDATSISDYQKRTYSVPCYELANLTNAKALANFYLAQMKDPRHSLTITVVNKDTTIYTQQLTLEISDRVTVVNTKLGINADYYIENMSHEITDSGKYHTTTYILSPTQHTVDLYMPEISGSGTTAIASHIISPAVNCTGLTKATGTLIIDLKCDHPELMSGGGIEIGSDGTADSHEWEVAKPAGITTSYQTFEIPLTSAGTSGGELDVSSVNWIRWYSGSTGGSITISWKNAKVVVA